MRMLKVVTGTTDYCVFWHKTYHRLWGTYRGVVKLGSQRAWRFLGDVFVGG